MHIIDYLDKLEATKLENQLIRMFTAAGQPLTNYQMASLVQRNPRFVPEIITRSVMRKIIKYKQEVYIHQYNQRIRNFDYSKKYPNEPFKP